MEDKYAKESQSMKYITLIIGLLVVGCGKNKPPNAEEPTPTTNTNKGNGTAADPAALPPNPQANKLSAEEVASLLADGIGRWKITGKSIPVGGDPEPFEDTMEIRWKVKGKSTAATFSPLINGERVPFVGYTEYDPQEGVFIWRSKGAGLPETVSREQYDPATKTYRGKSTYPDGAKETTTFEMVSKNKRLWTSQVEVDGKVVFSREAVFTRLADAEDRGKK